MLKPDNTEDMAKWEKMCCFTSIEFLKSSLETFYRNKSISKVTMALAEFQFIEKFQEVKEATRQAAQQKAQQQTNGSASTPVTSASASPCSSRSVPTPPVPSQTPTSESGGGTEDCVPTPANQIDHVVSSLPSNVNDIANTLKSSLVAHQRSQSLSGLQASKPTLQQNYQACISSQHSSLISIVITTSESLVVAVDDAPATRHDEFRTAALCSLMKRSERINGYRR
ncbi:homer 2 [Caerostris darwini]|uniref:Homer 2 n=1 Tax=Caerostris darwini TaxID=1538125 RepID=A0AAV4QMF8_9ARAC|nr:homer 2 [Caerostris darwini]